MGKVFIFSGTLWDETCESSLSMQQLQKRIELLTFETIA